MALTVYLLNLTSAVKEKITHTQKKQHRCQNSPSLAKPFNHLYTTAKVRRIKCNLNTLINTMYTSSGHMLPSDSDAPCFNSPIVQINSYIL